jgi:hypothetical protein
MTEDVLVDFPALRQAAIIRRYVLADTEPVVDRDGNRVAVQRYRSPAEVRAVVAETMDRHLDYGLARGWCSFIRLRVSEPMRKPADSGWRGRMFTEMAEFGSQCWACQSNPACYIDHDHFTGDVRGLLCSECNLRIEDCLHPWGFECFASEYLNYRPAWWLALRYRPENKVKRFDRIRCHVLGFNMFDVSCWPSKNPAEWDWTPPPDDSLRHIDACVLRDFRADWGTTDGRANRAQGNA